MEKSAEQMENWGEEIICEYTILSKNFPVTKRNQPIALRIKAGYFL